MSGSIVFFVRRSLHASDPGERNGEQHVVAQLSAAVAGDVRLPGRDEPQLHHGGHGRDDRLPPKHAGA